MAWSILLFKTAFQSWGPNLTTNWGISMKCFFKVENTLPLYAPIYVLELLSL
jgi:hypothetical protein